jgi:hypothetical protein
MEREADFSLYYNVRDTLNFASNSHIRLPNVTHLFRVSLIRSIKRSTLRYQTLLCYDESILLRNSTYFYCTHLFIYFDKNKIFVHLMTVKAFRGVSSV